MPTPNKPQASNTCRVSAQFYIKMPGLQYTPGSHIYVAVRRAWQTFHVATQIQWYLVNACLTLLEQLYGVSGQMYGCPKSLQQHVHCVCCPPPVLYLVHHWSRVFRQIYRCGGHSLHLPSHTGTQCVHGMLVNSVWESNNRMVYRASNKHRYMPLKIDHRVFNRGNIYGILNCTPHIACYFR